MQLIHNRKQPRRCKTLQPAVGHLITRIQNDGIKIGNGLFRNIALPRVQGDARRIIQAKQEGLIDLRQAGLAKIMVGDTSLDEVLAATDTW